MTWLIIFMFVAGFLLLMAGAEMLVRGASRLAVAAGISRLVVGLTVVAYGTSAPEMAVTIRSSYAGQADLAIGNVVGSNISNVLLVLGISAAAAPLTVSPQMVRSSVPLMIGVSLLVPLVGWNGTISQLEGLGLFAGAIAYTVYAIRHSRRAIRAEQHERGERVQAATELRVVLTQLGLMVLGLALLLLGSKWLVDGAVTLAKLLGVSELVIGLTIVAVGTSLPEVATSVVASIRGERDIAVGNVVGSNIFNVLLVLGACGAITPHGVEVPQPALRFDIPVMVAIAIACLPVFFTGYVISRWEGIVFLSYYAAYVLYLFFESTQHSALEPFSHIMFVYVVPLTALTLIILALRALRMPQASASQPNRPRHRSK